MSNTIAGTVYAGGVGVVGATVSWIGTSSGSTTSGAGGAYITSALGAGTYTLTCADAGYLFSTTLPQTIVASNLTSVNFVIDPEWVGQGDASGNWMDSNGTYLGPATKSRPWIGQNDALGNWMDSNGVYIGQPTSIPPPFPPYPEGVIPPLFASWFGMTWLKNVAVLTRDFWDSTQTTPYSGQLYPVPNTGGTQTGQVYPY
ncbi:MAG: hypothetical protein WA306_09390 [Candidatus Acidiferrales bacterium]